MKGRKLLILTFVILLLFIVAGCAGQVAEDEDVDIRVQAPVAPPSIPLVDMMGQENINLNWYGGMDEAMSRIIDGEVDISVIPVNSMAILYNRDAEIHLGAVSTWGILYLISDDPDINDWQDLEGETVGVGARGFSPDLVFRGLLNQEGMVVDEDIELLYGSSPEIAQLLMSKRLSTAVLPEPLLTTVLNRAPHFNIVKNLEDEWNRAFQTEGLPQAGLAVSKTFVEEHPELWQDFTRDYANNIEEYLNNPEKVGEKEEEVLNIPAEIIRESLGRSNLKFIDSLDAREDVNNYLEVLYSLEADTVGGSVPHPESDFYLK